MPSSIFHAVSEGDNSVLRLLGVRGLMQMDPGFVMQSMIQPTLSQGKGCERLVRVFASERPWETGITYIQGSWRDSSTS